MGQVGHETEAQRYAEARAAKRRRELGQHDAPSDDRARLRAQYDDVAAGAQHSSASTTLPFPSREEAEPRLLEEERRRAEAEVVRIAAVGAEQERLEEEAHQEEERRRRRHEEADAAPAAADAEAERLEAAVEEAARLEAEGLAAEEAARLEAERLEAGRLAAEEAARPETERIEAERKAAEEAAQLEAELAEAKRLDDERRHAEAAASGESERIEAARAAMLAEEVPTTSAAAFADLNHPVDAPDAPADDVEVVEDFGLEPSPSSGLPKAYRSVGGVPGRSRSRSSRKAPARTGTSSPGSTILPGGTFAAPAGERTSSPDTPPLGSRARRLSAVLTVAAWISGLALLAPRIGKLEFSGWWPVWLLGAAVALWWLDRVEGSVAWGRGAVVVFRPLPTLLVWSAALIPPAGLVALALLPVNRGTRWEAWFARGVRIFGLGLASAAFTAAGRWDSQSAWVAAGLLVVLPVVFWLAEALWSSVYLGVTCGLGPTDSQLWNRRTIAREIGQAATGVLAAVATLASPLLGLLVIPVLVAGVIGVQELSRSRLADADLKTGLLQLPAFNRFADRELDRSQRYNTPVTILMLDLDHLRELNNTYGHRVGDLAIERIAAVLLQHLRRVDLGCRYGGEEFTVLLPETDIDGACQFAERVRVEVAAEPVMAKSGPVPISVSIGVSQYAPGLNLEQLSELADKALYDAKDGGRNRVMVRLPAAPEELLSPQAAVAASTASG